MNKLYLLACLLVPVANAQTAPKVVFTGDWPVYWWQATPQFLANSNWIGAGEAPGPLSSGSDVEADYQANVINQHPAFVFIMIGTSALQSVRSPTPLGYEWHGYEQSVQSMVATAKAANIKVILGNVTAPGYEAQLFNQWLNEWAAANNVPVVNYHDALCQCADALSAQAGEFPTQSYETPQFNPYPNILIFNPTVAGYTLMTQMAQTAIATYGLTIKSGYLSNVYNVTANPEDPLSSNVNSVIEGEVVTFTPRAKWSDGLVRPILNQDFNGKKGAWISSNPEVMAVNQQGQATAYNVGKATISFKSASGVQFSPWVMTVSEFYPGVE